MDSIAEIVRKNEDSYLNEQTQTSKYVSFSMYETIEKITAYLSSKHITGEYDSLGRKKPFFNIGIAAANIWYRATDIDRSNIKIRGTKSKDWIDAFLATVFIQDWMRRENFGQFLNEWGRVLSRYGSAVIKCVENSSGLHLSVVPWLRIICDPVDFDANPKIEPIDLTEAELYARIDTHGYDKDEVEALCEALTERETLNKQRKDNKPGYVRIYEVHGKFPKSQLTDNEDDDDTFVQQMHVISFVGTKKGRKTEYEDFTLYRGRERRDPYKLTHLIKEDARTLSIGAIEYLFEPQFMVNHSMKTVKDTLDIGSRLILQTADQRFVDRNVLSNMESGDILINGGSGMEITKVEMSKPEIGQWGDFAIRWKSLGNEIVGISDAMLGVQPKSGTAWHQTEALLTESYSLFELMTENKGLYIEEIFREWVIPYIKRTQLDNADEISATLNAYDINRIDSIFIKSEAHRMTRQALTERILTGGAVQPGEQDMMQAQNESSVQDALSQLGGKRFFKPSEIGRKTWKTQFKDLEWELEIDVTGEQRDTQEMLTTLNTALKLVMVPGFDQNPKAQAIVGRALELTGAMSPLEWSTIPSPTPQPTPNNNGGGNPAEFSVGNIKSPNRNIKA